VQDSDTARKTHATPDALASGVEAGQLQDDHIGLKFTVQHGTWLMTVS